MICYIRSFYHCCLIYCKVIITHVEFDLNRISSSNFFYLILQPLTDRNASAVYGARYENAYGPYELSIVDTLFDRCLAMRFHLVRMAERSKALRSGRSLLL